MRNEQLALEPETVGRSVDFFVNVAVILQETETESCRALYLYE